MRPNKVGFLLVAFLFVGGIFFRLVSTRVRA